MEGLTESIALILVFYWKNLFISSFKAIMLFTASARQCLILSHSHLLNHSFEPQFCLFVYYIPSGKLKASALHISPLHLFPQCRCPAPQGSGNQQSWPATRVVSLESFQSIHFSSLESFSCKAQSRCKPVLSWLIIFAKKCLANKFIGVNSWILIQRPFFAFYIHSTITYWDMLSHKRSCSYQSSLGNMVWS